MSAWNALERSSLFQRRSQTRPILFLLEGEGSVATVEERMTSIYTVSRDDFYDHQRCPKIVAVKAYKAYRYTRGLPEAHLVRSVEPALIGMIGEQLMTLGVQNLQDREIINRIVRRFPQVNASLHLKRIVADSLRGMKEIRETLQEQYGKIRIIGKGEGRHPDLACTVQPDFIAFSTRRKRPIMVEVKETTSEGSSDVFQANFYNGVAERFGVYLLGKRFEEEIPAVSPTLIQSAAETLLVYPRLGRHSLVTKTFVPDLDLIQDVWKAKELGFKGLAPTTDCGQDCPHRRLKVALPEGNMEPLPPPPLILSEGVVESGYNLDAEYQVRYARSLLPESIRRATFSLDEGQAFSARDKWRDWLVQTGRLDRKAVDIALDLEKSMKLMRSRPDTERLLRSMKNELEPWKQILKKRLKTAAPTILGRATSIYPLPNGSARFVRMAWKRWQ